MIVAAGIVPYSPLYLTLKPEAASDFVPVERAVLSFASSVALRHADSVVVLYADPRMPRSFRINVAPKVTPHFPPLQSVESPVRLATNVLLAHALRESVESKVESAAEHETDVALPQFLAAVPLANAAPSFVFVGVPELDPHALYKVGTSWRDVIEAKRLRVAVVIAGTIGQALRAKGPNGYKAESEEFASLFRQQWLEGSLEPLLDVPPSLRDAAKEDAFDPACVFAGMVAGMKADPAIAAYDDSYGIGYMAGSWL